MRTSIVELLDELGPTARKLGCSDELSRVSRILDGPSYERQRRAAPDIINKPSDLKPVVDLLISEMATDVVGP